MLRRCLQSSLQVLLCTSQLPVQFFEHTLTICRILRCWDFCDSKWECVGTELGECPTCCNSPLKHKCCGNEIASAISNGLKLVAFQSCKCNYILQWGCGTFRTSDWYSFQAKDCFTGWSRENLHWHVANFLCLWVTGPLGHIWIWSFTFGQWKSCFPISLTGVVFGLAPPRRGRSSSLDLWPVWCQPLRSVFSREKRDLKPVDGNEDSSINSQIRAQPLPPEVGEGLFDDPENGDMFANFDSTHDDVYIEQPEPANKTAETAPSSLNLHESENLRSMIADSCLSTKPTFALKMPWERKGLKDFLNSKSAPLAPTPVMQALDVSCQPCPFPVPRPVGGLSAMWSISKMTWPNKKWKTILCARPMKNGISFWQLARKHGLKVSIYAGLSTNTSLMIWDSFLGVGVPTHILRRGSSMLQFVKWFRARGFCACPYRFQHLWSMSMCKHWIVPTNRHHRWEGFWKQSISASMSSECECQTGARTSYQRRSNGQTHCWNEWQSQAWKITSQSFDC